MRPCSQGSAAIPLCDYLWVDMQEKFSYTLLSREGRFAYNYFKLKGSTMKKTAFHPVLFICSLEGFSQMVEEELRKK